MGIHPHDSRELILLGHLSLPPSLLLFFSCLSFINDVSVVVSFTKFHIQGNLWHMGSLSVLSHENQPMSRGRAGQRSCLGPHLGYLMSLVTEIYACWWETLMVPIPDLLLTSPYFHSGTLVPLLTECNVLIV